MVRTHSQLKAAPQLGMLAPPPMLWVTNRPVPFGMTNSFNSMMKLAVTDRYGKVFTPMPPMPVTVPAMVVAHDETPSSSGDEESLSDSSSCLEDVVAAQSQSRFRKQLKRVANTTTDTTAFHSMVSSLPLPPPPGRPLHAKPTLLRASFVKTYKKPRITRTLRDARVAVPLKSAESMTRGACALSQDEKLFVEAAATLVRSGPRL